VLAGDLDDLPEHIIGVQGTGRVIRVDQHNRPRLGGNLAAHIDQIGQPAIRFVAQIMPWRAAGQTDRRRPQRVIRRRHQHLIADIEQGIHRHHDQLGNAITQVNVIQRHALDLLLLAVVHDRLARRENPLGIGITGRIRQIADHVLLDLFGRIKAERGQVADVQLDDLVALFLHLLGFLQHGAADVIADVGEFGGFLDMSHEVINPCGTPVSMRRSDESAGTRERRTS